MKNDLLSLPDKMYSVSNQAERCIDCQENGNNNGWFICQECYRIFCSQHSIIHRHRSDQQAPTTTERYDRFARLSQIAAWERRAIDRIHRQADEARRPLLAPPTPITETPPFKTLVTQLNYAPLTRLLTFASHSENETFIIDQYELLSNETLDGLISDGPLTSPLDETKIPGRVSFASQYPYMNNVHRLRLSINRFNHPSSWAFAGIISEGARIDDPIYPNRSSFGWHLGRQSIISDRQTSTSHDYDGRDIRQGDILTVIIDCNEKTIEMKNGRTLCTHVIHVNSNCCPLPWLFAVNFNYQNQDLLQLLH